MIIGRSNESTIVLSDPMVSRSHARISLEKGQWILEDLGSANGTISDGQKMKRKSLRLGDSFQVGLNVFRVVDEEISEKDPSSFRPNLWRVIKLWTFSNAASTIREVLIASHS